MIKNPYNLRRVLRHNAARGFRTGCPMSAKPAFLLSLRRLAVTGVLFYASYGLANYLSGLRAPLPEVVFAWESAIPFLPWAVFPYWGLNLLYALGFFLCEDDTVQRRYMAQLWAAQAVAVGCFLIFPLQISWVKPEVDGLAGRLFASLAQFDAPFNQAPSLHVMLALIVGRFYWYYLPDLWRLPWAAWCVLMGGSVLPTWQHHFIDVPTGLLAGSLVLWALPWQGDSPLRVRAVPHRTPALLYGAAALLCGAGAWAGGAWLWLLWPAAALALYGACYARFGAYGWQKHISGRHSLPVTLLMLPLRPLIWLNMRFWLRGRAQTAQVQGNLHIGSILAARAYAQVLDVCAEYAVAAPPAYRCIAMLDMVAPLPGDLRRAADALQAMLANGQPTLVCCALGYGRSAAVVLTWMLRHGGCATLAEAESRLRRVRPNMVLPGRTAQAIAIAVQNSDFLPQTSASYGKNTS